LSLSLNVPMWYLQSDTHLCKRCICACLWLILWTKMPLSLSLNVPSRYSHAQKNVCLTKYTCIFGRILRLFVQCTCRLTFQCAIQYICAYYVFYNFHSTKWHACPYFCPRDLRVTVHAMCIIMASPASLYY